MSSRFETKFNLTAIPLMERFFGVTVTIARGMNVSDEFTARRNYVSQTGTNSETSSQRRQYLLPVASVIIDGVTVEPKTGWRITEGDEVYEIQPPNDEKPSVEQPTGNNDWLCHTIRVQ